MPNTFIQPAFTSGELSPQLHGRVDMAKYHVGLKKAKNGFVSAQGGFLNRSGTAYVGRCKDGNNPVRLIPFQFSTVQSYALEFGQYYMRVVMNGAYVLEPAKTITGITQASPGVVTSSAHGFSNGDWVYLSGIAGMTGLNATTAVVQSATTNTFALYTLDGTPLSTSGYSAYTSGGTVARVFTLTTPYAGTDLALLKYTQSADTMTLCHPSYAPANLTRTQHYAWQLTTISFVPLIAAPASAPTVTPSNAGTTTYRYVITATNGSEESLGSAVGQTTASAAMSTTNTAWIAVSWPAVSGATQYNIYRQKEVAGSSASTGSLYGYVGASYGTSFNDQNLAPDFTNVPPQGINPFAGGNNPGVVTYFEQRRCYGGSNTYPQTLWFSQIANFNNFNVSNPTKATDAITATINAQQVNQIKHFVPTNSLIVLSSGAAWRVTAGSATEALTPTNTVIKPQAYNGCSDVPPIVVNTDILYIQSKGSIVRDLNYNFYVDVYTGTDITVMSNHLFYGYQLTEWAYAEEPYKLIWAIRNDGNVLILTYLKEQEINAWTWATTPGNSGTDKFQSVCSISEGAENAVYFVVQRTIPGVNGGNPVKYVERLHSRNFNVNGVADIRYAWFVDCAAQYNGAPTSTVSGLDYLNGCTVSILADGNVQPQQVVTNGKVSLQKAASIVTVGLPYESLLQTLPLENPNGSTLQSKRKRISAVTVRVDTTRGIQVDNGNNFFLDFKERDSSITYGQPIAPITGTERVLLSSRYDTDGSIILRQQNPLPMQILAIVPEVEIGDTNGQQ